MRPSILASLALIGMAACGDLTPTERTLRQVTPVDQWETTLARHRANQRQARSVRDPLPGTICPPCAILERAPSRVREEVEHSCYSISPSDAETLTAMAAELAGLSGAKRALRWADHADELDSWPMHRGGQCLQDMLAAADALAEHRGLNR